MPYNYSLKKFTHSLTMKIENKYKLQKIETAIWYWEEKLKGTNFWWDENDYSKEWIISQIKYFQEMKTLNSK